MWNDDGHPRPLYDRLFGQRSLMGSVRLRLLSLRTNRYRSSFIPRAIMLYNERQALQALTDNG